MPTFIRLAVLAGGLGLVGACTGVDPDDRQECEEDAECVAAFGGGSTCVAASGLCTAPQRCSDDTECVREFGAGFTCAPGEAACFGTGSGEPVLVSEAITTDQTWTADNRYVLAAVVFVAPGATLTIEAGTLIQGQQGGALVVEPGGLLDARGTEAAPIVFTSDQPEGQRAPGDWAGVALLGNATTNATAPVLEGLVDETRAHFGGQDDEWNCGALEYVRIEFAGFALELDEELNGLTLAGCGRGTIVDHVQVHYGKDDGVEIFGGTVSLNNIVLTRAQDDSLDWDLGWRGTAQFIAVQQDADGDNGFEASSSPDEGASPVASPRIYNLTLVGAEGSTRGATLKDGTGGQIANAIFFGHGLESIDVQDAQTVSNLQNGALSVTGSIFFDAGSVGDHFFPTVDDETEQMPDDGLDDDEGFDEDAFFRGLDNVLGLDPILANPLDPIAPGWVPSNAMVVQDAAIAPPPGFDEGARYCGAFAPNQPAWTIGWTDYPPN